MGIAIANRKNRCDFGALSSQDSQRASFCYGPSLFPSTLQPKNYCDITIGAEIITYQNRFDFCDVIHRIVLHQINSIRF